MSTILDTVNGLKAAIHLLPAKDQSFAASLITSVTSQRQPATAKQAYWLEELLRRTTAAAPAPVTKTTAVGDLTGVLHLFDRARHHLKHPAIVLGWRDDREWINSVRINIAGERARFPGSLNVVDPDSRVWFGRIHEDGTFEHSRRDEPPAPVVALLGRFAADPVNVAGEHGRLTGKCCFCNSGLKDERSTAVGYGKTCADHFGLPWGAKAARAKQAELHIAA